MILNPQFLKTFLILAEEGGFTKTAKRLSMTQPGVSQHVRWLEEYFEVPLINRHGKSFEVTPQGHLVIAYAENLFNQHQTFKESLKEDNPLEGPCTFASPGSFGIRMYSFLLNLNKKSYLHKSNRFF